MNILWAFLTSFCISFFSLPSIIRVGHLKDLTAKPCERKKHDSHIPTLGGVAIFASVVFGLSFWVKSSDFYEMKFIISSIILIFFIGIKDDLYLLVSYKKLIAQIVAAIILVHFGEIRLFSMYGLFGVYLIPTWLSYLLSVLTITVITNAFNLIDGVNWLAASIALIIASFFGGWFYLIGYNSMSLMAFCLVGSLLAFMYYNRTPAKVFMGDTGSLLIGLIISILAIKFIEFNRTYSGDYHITSVPAVAIGILIIPLYDLVRVFLIRVYQRKSPLSADRNHTHHMLLELGLSHMQTSGLLSLINIFFIIFVISMRSLEGEMLLGLIIILAFSLSSILMLKSNRRKLKDNGVPLLF